MLYLSRKSKQHTKVMFPRHCGSQECLVNCEYYTDSFVERLTPRTLHVARRMTMILNSNSTCNKCLTHSYYWYLWWNIALHLLTVANNDLPINIISAIIGVETMIPNWISLLYMKEGLHAYHVPILAHGIIYRRAEGCIWQAQSTRLVELSG